MPYLLLTGSGIQIPMKRGRNARDEKREARSGLWVLLCRDRDSKGRDQGQAVWSRRWPVEITCCARRKRWKAGERDDAGYGSTAGVAKKSGFPGILSLDAQVRIGPLRQSACQSMLNLVFR
ncbi:hypothetical protein FPV67DRAFT_163212 [Lyophyllum atratum]|nr:hypothetical protein FPV67DRAFT_163212 [Lyophyllum atratum]